MRSTLASPTRLSLLVVAALPVFVAAVPAVVAPLPEAESVATPLPRPDRPVNPLRDGPADGTAPAGRADAGKPQDTGKENDQADAKAKSEKPARDGRCDVCGGDRFVCTVCVPRKTEKKVKKVCWGVKCEPLCVPGRSLFCGWKCERDECGCWTYPVWQPTCAEVIERRIPDKREVTRVIPTWEWKAEERCAACACGLPGDRSCTAAP